MANESIPQLTQPINDSTAAEPSVSQDASLDSAKSAQPSPESNRVADIKGGIESAIAKIEPASPKGESIELPQLSDAQLAQLLKTIKRKVKVNGAEMEVGLDDLEKDYQLKSASHEKMREAAALRKQVEEYTALIKSDPRKALKMFGVDVRQLAESELSEALEEEMMTPEAKEVRALKRQLAERDAADSAALDAARHEAELAQVPVLKAQYDTDIQAALRGAGLPVTPALMRAVAAQARRDLDDKIEINFSAISEQLAQQFQGHITETVSNSDIAKLVAMLGESGMKKIREYDLGRLKQTAPAVPASEQPAATESKRKEKETLEQYMARRRKSAGID